MLEREALAVLAAVESDALLVVLDAAGRIVLFNPACARATGFAESDVAGRAVWDALTAPDERADARAAFERLLAAGEPAVRTREAVWLTKAGGRRVVAWRDTVRADLADGETLVISTGVDVTDLRARESALEERAARLESLLRASRDGVVTILENGEVTTFSEGAEKLFGYAADEVIGRNVSMLMPEPYAAAHDGYVDAYVRTRDAQIIGLGREVLARRSDGEVFPIHLMVEEGRLGGTRFFTGVIRDLSERAQLEKSLHEKEAQFEAVFQSAPDALVISDADGRIVTCNPAFERTFRCARADAIGTTKRALFVDPNEFEERWASRVAAHGPARPSVVRFRRPDGEEFPGEIVDAELRESGGELVGYLALIRDVSDELRREEALRQAQKMEAIGQLTGGMAHDFNNLLTVIRGNLELVEMSLQDSEQAEMLAEAREAADMGASLTSRMLAFARRQALKPQRVDMNALVVSLSELLRRTLGERVQLSTSLEPRLPGVLVDPAQLQNAVLNLALNARDAMPEGGAVAIETGVLAETDAALRAIDPAAEGGWVTLTVADTGAGIPPQVRDRLFDPYVTTKPAGQGGGLGLAMVFGFVKQSGGHIAVESEPGEGASFTIYLPQAETPPDESVAEPGAGASAAAGGGETVLVVEDNAAVRRLARRRLEGLGYAVIEAADAAAALGLIDESADFDLLFTDVVMPGKLDGLALAKAARERRPGLKLLLTSGYLDPERVGAAEALRGVELLRKPNTLPELAAAVRRALAG